MKLAASLSKLSAGLHAPHTAKALAIFCQALEREGLFEFLTVKYVCAGDTRGSRAHQVQGCSFGHPRAVLMAAVGAVHEIPSSFVQGSHILLPFFPAAVHDLHSSAFARGACSCSDYKQYSHGSW